MESRFYLQWNRGLGRWMKLEKKLKPNESKPGVGSGHNSKKMRLILTEKK